MPLRRLLAWVLVTGALLTVTVIVAEVRNVRLTGQGAVGGGPQCQPSATPCGAGFPSCCAPLECVNGMCMTAGMAECMGIPACQGSCVPSAGACPQTCCGSVAGQPASVTQNCCAGFTCQSGMCMITTTSASSSSAGGVSSTSAQGSSIPGDSGAGFCLGYRANVYVWRNSSDGKDYLFFVTGRGEQHPLHLTEYTGTIDINYYQDVSMNSWYYWWPSADPNIDHGGYDRWVIRGGEGNDRLIGNDESNIICGGGGKDYLFGNGGGDVLSGGAGQDVLFGGLGRDLLYGDLGPYENYYLGSTETGTGDVLYGDGAETTTTGGDILCGGEGNDVMLGTAGNDLLCGNDGDDVMEAYGGNDKLQGHKGTNDLDGGAGSDVCLLGSTVAACEDQASAINCEDPFELNLVKVECEKTGGSGGSSSSAVSSSGSGGSKSNTSASSGASSSVSSSSAGNSSSNSSSSTQQSSSSPSSSSQANSSSSTSSSSAGNSSSSNSASSASSSSDASSSSASSSSRSSSSSSSVSPSSNSSSSSTTVSSSSSNTTVSSSSKSSAQSSSSSSSSSSYSSLVTALLICGNGTTEGQEECDDGNGNDGDGCSRVCRREITLSQGSTSSYVSDKSNEGSEVADNILVAAAPICGNGLIESAEECDDGNRRDEDGCSSTCLLAVGICGDGKVQSLLGEQCESAMHDAALAYACVECRFLSWTCGDGAIDAGEECDEGRGNADEKNASCRSDCSLARCGDGIIDSVEKCDDGNRRGGDGCDSSCGVEKGSQVAAVSETETGTPPLGTMSGSPYANVAGGLYGQFPFPYAPIQGSLPFNLPYAQLQPLLAQTPQAPKTGPAAVAVIGAGAAAGFGWMRRRRK